MNEQLRRVQSWTARLALAAMFAVAGLSKIGGAAEFARDIANYRLVPDAVAVWAALFLPVLELVIAVGLLLPRYARGAGALSALLLAAFAAAMAQAKLRGIDLACGCFGGDSQVSWGKVALNLVLAGLAVRVVAFTAGPPSERETVASGGRVT